jgi:hypothetical protein
MSHTEVTGDKAGALLHLWASITFSTARRSYHKDLERQSDLCYRHRLLSTTPSSQLSVQHQCFQATSEVMLHQ